MKDFPRLFYIFSIIVILILALSVASTGCKQEYSAETATQPGDKAGELLPSGSGQEMGKELDVYVWEGYLPENAIKIFEQETGINLNVTFATDNAAMLTLLKGGGIADIVMPTQNQVNRFYESGLVQPLDLNKIPNYSKIPAAFKGQPWAKWDGSSMGAGDTYVIPYVFGTSGLIINTEKYTGLIDQIGWEILFDPALKERASSKNAAESLMICLDTLGIQREKLVTDTQQTLEAVRPQVLKLKDNVLKFYDSGAELLDLLKNDEVYVSHIWDGGGRKMIQFDPKFAYALPKTGGLGWTDTFMITKNSANPAGAHLFIDFMLRPEIAAMLTDESGYTTTVEGALEKSTVGNKEAYSFSEDEINKLIWQANFTEEVIEAYTTFWEEISTVN